MEQNLTSTLRELTAIPARQDGSQILRMDDPELLNYPLAYLSEPGCPRVLRGKPRSSSALSPSSQLLQLLSPVSCLLVS